MDAVLMRLANHWRTHGASPDSGAPEAEIAAFEVRHGVQLPPELREYFATLNRLAHGRDDMDNETIGFWRLADVAPVAEEAPDAGVARADRCFVIADYLIGSRFYVVRLPDDPAATAEIRSRPYSEGNRSRYRLSSELSRAISPSKFRSRVFWAWISERPW